MQNTTGPGNAKEQHLFQTNVLENWVTQVKEVKNLSYKIAQIKLFALLQFLLSWVFFLCCKWDVAYSTEELPGFQSGVPEVNSAFLALQIGLCFEQRVGSNLPKLLLLARKVKWQEQFKIQCLGKGAGCLLAALLLGKKTNVPMGACGLAPMGGGEKDVRHSSGLPRQTWLSCWNKPPLLHFLQGLNKLGCYNRKLAIASNFAFLSWS